MKLAALALMIVTATAAAQPAPHPEPDPDRPKALYVEGKRYYDLADYERAIAAWKQAYVLSNAPMLLFNLGQAYRLKGDCTSALRFYANYEREAGPAPDNKTELDEAKARCNPQPTNANPPPTFPPANHPPTTATLQNAEIEPTPMKPIATMDDQGGPLQNVGIVTGVGGIFAIALGVYLATRAQHDADQISDFRGEWSTTQSDLQREGKRAALWSEITIGVGIGAIITGGVIYYVGVHRKHVAEHARISVLPRGAGLSWAASF